MGYELIIVIVVLVLSMGFIIFLFFNSSKQKKLLVERLNQIGEFKNNILTIKDEKFFVQMIKVNPNEEFTVNSKTIIQVRRGSNSKLIDVNQNEYKKLILVYPFEGKIKRYINENEMEFINYKNFFWNMYVVTLSELENFKKMIEDKQDELTGS